MQGCIFCNYAGCVCIQEEPLEKWEIDCEKTHSTFIITESEVYKGCPLTAEQRELNSITSDR